MNAEEYARMYELEDHYWWFVGRRRAALRLLRKYMEAEGVKEPSPPTPHTPHPTPLILDLGCGTGVVLRELSGWARPVGLDMSERALDFCRRRGLGRLVRGEGESLPIATGSVDAVLGLDVFEHIPDDRAALAEACRVLRPGGILVLSVPAFRWLWGPHDVALMHHRRYRRPEVRDRLREAGFDVRRASYAVFFLFPIVAVVRFLERRRPGPAKASLVPVPRWLNSALIALQGLEGAMVERFDLPWGSSVVAVARKPR